MALISDPNQAALPNPDDDLSIYSFISKYQLQFTKHFGPKYAYGITTVVYSSAHKDNTESLIATARVRPVHQSTRGATCQFTIPYGKFLIWRKNVKLYDFISVK